MLDNYPFIIRSTLDIDMINITIDQTTEDEIPLNNCIELLHEILVNSVNYQDMIAIFNLVFTGKEEDCKEVNEHFLGESANPSERVKQLLTESLIIEA